MRPRISSTTASGTNALSVRQHRPRFGSTYDSVNARGGGVPDTMCRVWSLAALQWYAQLRFSPLSTCQWWRGITWPLSGFRRSDDCCYSCPKVEHDREEETSLLSHLRNPVDFHSRCNSGIIPDDATLSHTGQSVLRCSTLVTESPCTLRPLLTWILLGLAESFV
jgi:hypothetical protein